MSFSTRRGRPAKEKPAKDMGTPELQIKRNLGITRESLDECLDRNIVSKDQHWAGLHLRWLYTIRYGAPSITSHFWREDGQRKQRFCDGIEDESVWRSERETEYSEARHLLLKEKYYNPVMQIAVYNETPLYLRPDILRSALHNPALVSKIAHEKQSLIHGLELLHRYWQQPSKDSR